jgi:hypothetical protein
MLISENIKELIQEGYLISDETISVDLHKFESGECNKLIISGLFGSEDGHVGNQLSMKYNCICYTGFGILMEIALNPDYKKYPIKKISELYQKRIIKLLTNKERCIITGFSFIMSMINKSLNIIPIISKLSCIFVGDSILKTSWKIAITSNRIVNPLILIIITLTNFITIQRYENQLKKARCLVKPSIIKPFDAQLLE